MSTMMNKINRLINKEVVTMFKAKNSDSVLIKTDKDYTLFDFCDQNNVNLKVTYKVRFNTFKEVEGYVSGYHPEFDMVSIKSGPEAYDYVIPIRNIEQIVITGSIV
jgi:hypothetical protein